MRVTIIIMILFLCPQSIWQASRWLFLLMVGLPTLIISVICYTLCCMETIDDFRDEDDYDSEEEGEEPPPYLEQGGDGESKGELEEQDDKEETPTDGEIAYINST